MTRRPRDSKNWGGSREGSGRKSLTYVPQEGKPKPRSTRQGKLLFTAHMALINQVEFATEKPKVDEMWDKDSEMAAAWESMAWTIRTKAAAAIG